MRETVRCASVVGLTFEVEPIKAEGLEYSDYLHQRSSKRIRSTFSSVSRLALRAWRGLLRCLAKRIHMRQTDADEEYRIGLNSLLIGSVLDCRMHRGAARIAGVRQPRTSRFLPRLSRSYFIKIDWSC